MGRELQRHYAQKPQVVITLPLLEGLDGVQKMSKSLGNYIGINEAPSEIFGKIMSISDDLMWRYYELLSFKTNEEIESLKQSAKEGRNPRDIKIELATELVERFHDKNAAKTAHEGFVSQFQKHIIPENIESKQLISEAPGLPIAYVLRDAFGISTSEALRQIEQGGVRIDGEKMEDKAKVIPLGAHHLIQMGKRKFMRIEVQAKN